MSPTASSSTYTFSTKQELKSARQVTKEEIWRDGRELGFVDNAIRVIEKRYLVRNENGEVIETPKGMFHRMARALAEVETRYGADAAQVKFWEKEFYGVLSRFEFTPAGRTITNAGAPTRVVANCIVLHFEDSMDGIFSTLRDASLLQQAGSGLGFAWHLLRPAGSISVKSRGQASGPVSFLRAYDHAFGTIKQQNRHGANMGVMRVDHPDILEFIDCKRKEGTIVNFNVSVGMTDEFMAAVKSESKEPWLCSWGDKKMKPRLIKRNNRGAYISHEDVTLTARELMDKIVDAAWSNGEPGVLFPDAANRENPVPSLGRLEATNPCVTGDTLIATDQGLQRADVLAQFGGPIGVVTDGRFCATTVQNASNVFATGIKDVVRVITRDGYELRCTPDHRLMTENGWVEAQALKQGDAVHIVNRKGRFGITGTLEEGQILGWLVGDGTISAIRAVLSFFGDEKRELAPLFAHAVSAVVSGIGTKTREYPVGVISIDKRDEARVASERLKVWAGQHGLTEEEHKQVPHTILTGSEDMARGFLQALFTADGSVQDGGEKGMSVRLAASHLSLLQDTQRVLLNFGIASRLYKERRPEQMRPMPDGKGGLRPMLCRAQHELVITKENLIRFEQEINFLTEEKRMALMDALALRTARGPYRESFTATVESVTADGRETVYDLTEPTTHSFIANGMVVHNCGEQWLHDGDVCNLGSINLAKFVKDGSVDEERLRYATSVATRMLDNVIDVSDFPVEKVNTRFRDNRRVGLGIMGFADMLYQMNVGYDTPEGLATAQRVMKIVNDAAHDTSQDLANTKGVFPNWEKSIFGPAGQNRPQRNAALTTVAPTGSISMFFDCSSGVEPFFALAYKKENIMGGDSLNYTNPHLEKTLKERGLYTEELVADIMERGTIQHRADLPEDLRRVYVTAMDISAEDHIRMQAAFQEHTDNSISKTINFPNNATHEDVRVGYMLAWELGCKGGTMYRDGSRDEQVLNLNSRKTEDKGQKTASSASAIGQTVHILEPRARPEVLRGTTYKLKTAYGNLYITINEDEHGPFEVFSQMGKAGGFFAANLEAICRMISLALRSGVHIESVIRQIKGIRDPQPIWHKGEMILSLPDAIGQILEKHMKSRQNKLDLHWGESGATIKEPVRLVLEKASGGFMDNGFAPACPDCGGVLAFQEGCAKCGACGFSRCG